jgi:putative lipoic acid-binding regulatory protein
MASDHRPSEDLLESHHEFPGPYQIKAIGASESGFPARVVAAAVRVLGDPGDLESSVRETKGGRHVAVTLHLTVQSAEQVRAIYAAIREVEGLTLLL